MSRARRTVLLLGALASAISIFAHGHALADAIVTIIQQNRAFSQTELRVHAGDTVRFANEDEFDHQVYVQSPTFNVDTDEASPGQKTDVRFTGRGTFEVRCHIHPRMHLTVTVE